MAKKTKTSRGRKQDRTRVAGGQDYEVRYESKKSGRSCLAVKKAVAALSSPRLIWHSSIELSDGRSGRQTNG